VVSGRARSRQLNNPGIRAVSTGNRQELIFLGFLVAMVIAANLPACDPWSRSASSSQQAEQIFEEA
jgi:hypothetical protein